MSPRALVATWTTRLAMAVLACGLAVGTGVAGLTYLLARWLGASPGASIAIALGLGALATVAEAWRRLGGPLTPARVSLWIEEHVPQLEFSLIAAVESPEAPAWCEARVRSVDVGPPGWRAIRRALRWPAVLAIAGVAAFAGGSRIAALESSLVRAVREAAAPGSAFSTLHARVTPPAYSRLAVEETEQPNLLHPLVGSTVELSGPLPSAVRPGDVKVTVDRTAKPAHGAANRWSVRLTADTATRIVRLAQGAESRLVVIEPRVDSLPVVTIRLPERDTILREPRGTLALRARATDDLRLESAAIEYIVSSGEGERFTFRSGTLGVVRPGARAADLAATFDAAALRLVPGDVVHIRAVARDGNTVGGPGIGSSDTRTIRVARAGEYDSVAVDPAPPAEADKSVISQRMLINLTEALVKRMRTLSRENIVAESRRISRDQARLRKQVSDLVFARLGDEPSGEHFHGDGHDHNEGEALKRNLTPEELLAAAEKATGTGADITEANQDETPIVAINRPLLEAYNAMWDAGRELDGGRPRTALPPMHAALAAIQKARAAERLYLRGVPPRVVVDVARARLAGKERGLDALRPATLPADPVRREAIQRMQRALALGTPGAAADSLLLVRLSIVGHLADAATAMDALIADVRAGRDASANIEIVRRALDRSTLVADSLSPWGGRR